MERALRSEIIQKSSVVVTTELRYVIVNYWEILGTDFTDISISIDTIVSSSKWRKNEIVWTGS